LGGHRRAGLLHHGLELIQLGPSPHGASNKAHLRRDIVSFPSQIRPPQRQCGNEESLELESEAGKSSTASSSLLPGNNLGKEAAKVLPGFEVRAKVTGRSYNKESLFQALRQLSGHAHRAGRHQSRSMERSAGEGGNGVERGAKVQLRQVSRDLHQRMRRRGIKMSYCPF